MLIKKESIKNEVKGSKNLKSPPFLDSNQQSHKGCCQTATQTVDQPSVISHVQQSLKPQQANQNVNKKNSSKTRLTIKYDAGFANQLYIRGQGANLTWNKGQLLKNIKPDEWVWEIDEDFNSCEFKILINDHVYETGDNHHLNAGATLIYTPYFY